MGMGLNFGFLKYIFGLKKWLAKKGPFHTTPQYEM
jgi:hypothetical protein